MNRREKAVVDSFIRTFLKANDVHEARRSLIYGLRSDEADLKELKQAVEEYEEDLYSSITELIEKVAEDYEFEDDEETDEEDEDESEEESEEDEEEFVEEFDKIATSTGAAVA